MRTQKYGLGTTKPRMLRAGSRAPMTAEFFARGIEFEHHAVAGIGDEDRLVCDGDRGGQQSVGQIVPDRHRRAGRVEHQDFSGLAGEDFPVTGAARSNRPAALTESSRTRFTCGRKFPDAAGAADEDRAVGSHGEVAGAFEAGREARDFLVAQQRRIGGLETGDVIGEFRAKGGLGTCASGLARGGEAPDGKPGQATEAGEPAAPCRGTQDRAPPGTGWAGQGRVAAG